MDCYCRDPKTFRVKDVNDPVSKFECYGDPYFIQLVRGWFAFYYPIHSSVVVCTGWYYVHTVDDYFLRVWFTVHPVSLNPSSILLHSELPT